MKNLMEIKAKEFYLKKTWEQQHYVMAFEQWHRRHATIVISPSSSFWCLLNYLQRSRTHSTTRQMEEPLRVEPSTTIDRSVDHITFESGPIQMKIRIRIRNISKFSIHFELTWRRQSVKIKQYFANEIRLNARNVNEIRLLFGFTSPSMTIDIPLF